MTVAYWCVLAAAGIPYLSTSLAKFAGGFGPRENKAPRDFLAGLEGWRKRAHWAQENGFEAFPPFAGAAQGTIDALALTFVGARLVYGFVYIADRGGLRSLVWGVGVGCVVGLFFAGA